MIGRIIRLEFEIILCQYRVYDEWDWFSLILRISVLLIIAARIDIAHYIRLLRKKWLSSHPKPQVHYPMGRVGSRLSKPAFSPSTTLEKVKNTPPFSMSKGGCFPCKYSFTASAVRVSWTRALLVYFR